MLEEIEKKKLIHSIKEELAKKKQSKLMADAKQSYTAMQKSGIWSIKK